MAALLQFLHERLKPYWHKLWAALALAAALFLTTFIATLAAKSTILSLTLAAIAAALFLCCWWIVHRIPSTRSGKVGIAVAIASDSETEAKQIHTDFVRELRQLLEEEKAGTNFDVVEIPQFACESAHERANARRLLEKTKAHLILFGFARCRPLNGKPTHLVELAGYVRHTPIPQEVSTKFGQDFRQFLPKRIEVPDSDAAVLFETNSRRIDLAARFVVGRAAFYSGDIVYAEHLLLSAESKLKTAQIAQHEQEPLAKTLTRFIGEIYTTWLSNLYDRYFSTRQPELVEFLEKISDKLLARDAHHYSAILCKGIAHFALRRDLPAAHATISRCKELPSKDGTWMFSRAFLFGYEGKAKKAYEEYKRAFRTPSAQTSVPIQCEEFIHMILAEEPERTTLLFCSGLLNLYGKKDHLSAVRDFTEFVGKVCESDEWSRKTTKELLRECSKLASSPAAIGEPCLI